MLPQRNMCSAYVVNSQSDKPSCFASFFSLSAGTKLINEFIYTHAGTWSIDNASIPTPLFPDYFCRNMWIPYVSSVFWWVLSFIFLSSSRDDQDFFSTSVTGVWTMIASIKIWMTKERESTNFQEYQKMGVGLVVSLLQVVVDQCFYVWRNISTGVF